MANARDQVLNTGTMVTFATSTYSISMKRLFYLYLNLDCSQISLCLNVNVTALSFSLEATHCGLNALAEPGIVSKCKHVKLVLLIVWEWHCKVSLEDTVFFTVFVFAGTVASRSIYSPLFTCYVLV